jgi:hypothetical protein
MRPRSFMPRTKLSNDSLRSCCLLSKADRSAASSAKDPRIFKRSVRVNVSGMSVLSLFAGALGAPSCAIHWWVETTVFLLR